MTNIKQYNDRYKYILFIIDVFSKKAKCVALKNKTATTCAEAFTKIFTKEKCEKIQTDLGTEFYGSETKTVFKKFKVHHFSTHGGTKCALAENLIKNMKARLYRYFEEKNTYRYLDVLGDLMVSYNNTKHSRLKMTPNEAADPKNRDLVWKTLFGKDNFPNEKLVFKIGDKVRIKLDKPIFRKGYQQSFSNEVFEIYRTYKDVHGPTVYYLIDANDEVIDGPFYYQELIEVRKSDDDTYKIEQILKRRGKGKNREVLVKWWNHPINQASWIKESDVKKL